MTAIRITGAYATKLIRASRCGAAPALVRRTTSETTPSLTADLTDSRLREWLFSELGYDGVVPVSLRVATHAERVRYRGLESHVSSSLEPGLVRQLDLSPNHKLPDGTPSPEILVDAPILNLLTLADQLDTNATAGSIERMRADILTIDRACEFCGTYSLDPSRPNQHEAHYELTPVLSQQELLQYLSGNRRHIHSGGLRRLRIAAKYAFDHSASPSETMAGMALTIMPRLGGFHLPGMIVNQPLAPELMGIDGVLHQQLTPDFAFADTACVIEIQGKGHELVDARHEDRRRHHDYDLLGITSLFVEASEYASPPGISGIALEIAAAIDRATGKDLQVNRIRRLAKDKGFKQRQQILFETLHTMRS